MTCRCAICDPAYVMTQARQAETRTVRRLTPILWPLTLLALAVLGVGMLGWVAWRLVRQVGGFVRYRLGCAWRGEWKEAGRWPTRMRRRRLCARPTN